MHQREISDLEAISLCVQEEDVARKTRLVACTIAHSISTVDIHKNILKEHADTGSPITCGFLTCVSSYWRRVIKTYRYALVNLS